MIDFNNIQYIDIETDKSKIARQQKINKLKKQIISEVKNYCKKLNNGYSDFCYQDTMNKLMLIQFEKDLNINNLTFN